MPQVILSLYLTDSVNFRIYIGTYDEENEMITTECNGGDSIYVEKRLNLGPRGVWKSVKIEDQTTYSISDLKKRHAVVICRCESPSVF